METYLLDQLTEYAASDAYPLHMPGHKRQMQLFEDAFSIDITEIEGFDNLHHAQGILLEAQQRAARLYGADETYYLVNGSTCGVLAAISASVQRGGRILMARNSHKAAFHAALLKDLHVSWLYPEMDLERGMYGSISPQQVRDALRAEMPAGRAAGKPSNKTGEITEKLIAEKGQIEAVFITSPTYDGVVSDIRSIAREVHALGALLIVDEAHGAHFAMHSYFPESALSCGADIVVNSLHKTMPSLTQTALLHVKGERADRERLRKYLDIYQSSSPSYVLMAGMDECVRLMEARGEELFGAFVGRLEKVRAHLGKMQVLHLVTGDEPELAAFAFDRSKILISTAQVYTENGRMTGSALAQILRECYHLEVEMSAEYYVTALMTVADTQEGFNRLEAALLEIDGQLSGAALSEEEQQPDGAALSEGEQQPDETVPSGEKLQPDEIERSEPAHGSDPNDLCGNPGQAYSKAIRMETRPNVSGGVGVLPFPTAAMTMTEADDMPHESVLLEDSPGRVAAEFVYLYPPGIPLLVPGERVPEQFPRLLDEYRQAELQVQGMEDYSARTLRCIAEDARA